MTNIRYLIFIVLIILTACEPEEVVIPTLASIPTVTPSDTPVPEPTQTDTPVPTLTPTPSETPTATPTPQIPTNTAIPTASPTNTLTPIPSATNTPTATLTPIPTRTPAMPEIVLYQSNKELGSHGDPIILRWETHADEVRLELRDAQDNILNSIPVQTVGSLNTNLPTTGSMAVYQLVASRAGSSISSRISFQLTPLCTTTWFFENAPSSIGCPSGPVAGGQLTYQQFERGFMFHLTSQGVDRVCGVQNDRNLYSCFAYLAYTGTPTVTPVPQREEPGPDFENVFYTQLAIGGFWYSIIGWGTSPQFEETIEVQSGENGKLYVRLPAGIYGFDANLTSVSQPIEHIP